MAAQKTCTKCGRRKLLNRFRPNRRTCWDCVRVYGSAWYRANRDRINEKRRARYPKDRKRILALMKRRRGGRSLYRPYRVGGRWADGGAAWRGRRTRAT